MIVTAALAVLASAHPVSVPAAAVADTACIVMNDNLARRPSPLDSVSFAVQGVPVKICYGRPSARGRTMIGGEQVPYGQLWRTGANEPTMIHTAASLSVAGIAVPAGTYSLYTVPGEREWQIIVNRSTSQWGHESRYTEQVQAQELGRAAVPSERVERHIETFTIRAEPGPGGVTHVVLEWERTRVRIPVRKGD
jgi:hypothetical protein